jgi:hypothetical protein
MGGGGGKPPDIPELEDPEVAEARERERLAALKRKGRRSTILTSAAGVSGDTPLVPTSLLGGAAQGAG